MHNVDDDEQAAEILDEINPRSAVPTFDVEGRIVFGFNPRELEMVIANAARARL